MGTNYESDELTGQTRTGNVTNNVTTGPDGLTLLGTARKKAKLTIAGGNFQGGSTSPANAVLNDITFVYSFKKNADECVLNALQMPNDYEEGTDVIVNIIWGPADTDTGNVKWDVKYNLVDDGDNIATAATTLTLLQAGPGVTEQRVTTGDFTIPGASILKSTLINLQVERNGSDGTDTYNNDAYLCAAIVQYTKNTLGSAL